MRPGHIATASEPTQSFQTESLPYPKSPRTPPTSPCEKFLPKGPAIAATILLFGIKWCHQSHRQGPESWATYGSGPHTKNITDLPSPRSPEPCFAVAPKRRRHQLSLPILAARSIALRPIRPTVVEEEDTSECAGPSSVSTKNDSFNRSG